MPFRGSLFLFLCITLIIYFYKMDEYKNLLTIKSWAEEDRPREKLLIRGKEALSSAELIAILIGSGSRNETAVELSKRILNQCGDNLNMLGRLSVNELMKFKGIGEAKAITIVAALELGRRRQSEDVVKREQITCSSDVYTTFGFLADSPHEEFWVLYLNKANKILTKQRISVGGVDGTVADVKIIFQKALELLASSVILCHNHPSGSLKPSKADIVLTKKIKQASEFLEISLLDHLIVSESGYYSFADEGELS